MLYKNCARMSESRYHSDNDYRHRSSQAQGACAHILSYGQAQERVGHIHAA